jgi:hypothetical protein
MASGFPYMFSILKKNLDLEYTSQMLNNEQNVQECDATEADHYCPVKLSKSEGNLLIALASC